MANIVEVAQQAGQFNTLLKAAAAADLADTLATGGPWTVFAPTDEAFSKLPAGTIDELLNDIPKLKQILLYHVAQGNMLADDVMESEQIQMMNGDKVNVDISEGVMINNANVLQTDIEADNGVIHVIDTVILPGVPSKMKQE